MRPFPSGMAHQNPPVTPAHYSEMAKMLESNKWTYAKSMPKWPHHWSARADWGDTNMFTQVAQFIEDHGVKEPWGNRKPLTYLYLNGYRYWTMGHGAQISTIINRNKPNYNSEYDQLAGGYDAKYATKADLAENSQLVKLYPPVGRVLDIGCGTGMAVEWGRVKPEDYVGIDPSMAMLQVFMTKHPEFAMSLRCSKFEHYYDEGFDTIIAYFAAANYIPNEHLDRIQGMLNPGGKAHLMFYRAGYTPRIYNQLGLTDPPLRPNHTGVPFSEAYVVETIHA